MKIQLFRDELGSIWEDVMDVANLPIYGSCFAWCPSSSCALPFLATIAVAAVEGSMDQMMLDLWGRRFQSLEGKTLPAQSADQFRVATPALDLLVFTVFKLNFEHYETWHLRQRGRLLMTKYEKGMQGIFQDLKPPCGDRLDLLLHSKRLAVLAVDNEKWHVAFGCSITLSGFSRWTVDDMTIEPQIVNEVVIQLPDVSTIGLGDVVEQRCFQSETQALHEELLSYWTPTWQATSTVEPSTWNWVIAFFQAHAPQLQLQLGPISPDQWFGALR